MKIHGTAKGGALSKKDFGVAFGGGGADFIEATGGTITTDDDYKVHSFTSVGNATFEITSGTGNVEYLVIGGGGGGGRGNGGGAGAGAFRTDTKTDMTVGTFAVTVGAKGLGLTTEDSDGSDNGFGGDSVFDDITANGGGFGGGEPKTTTERDGGNSVNGSGGGAGTGGAGGSSGTYGFNGGNGGDPAGAGGGGSGSIGVAGSSDTGGNGGNGTASDIIENGTDVIYAGGGGGSTVSGTVGSGGLGGGGDGAASSNTGGDGSKAGAGGGGARSGTGGDGADGIVILRYQFQ